MAIMFFFFFCLKTRLVYSLWLWGDIIASVFANYELKSPDSESCSFSSSPISTRLPAFYFFGKFTSCVCSTEPKWIVVMSSLWFFYWPFGNYEPPFVSDIYSISDLRVSYIWFKYWLVCRTKVVAVSFKFFWIFIFYLFLSKLF